MRDYLLFEHESGELIIFKRSAITSFHPKYSHGRGYVVHVSDGAVEKPIYKCHTLEEAKAWCLEQVGLIEGDSSPLVKKKVGKSE